MRRVGKSTIMRQIRDELLAGGASPENVLYLDLDSRVDRDVTTPDALDERISLSIGDVRGQRYLFVDEIQNVEGFETVINAYRNEGVSVFITGSNSYLLSGELVTKLTGRYVKFRIFPFSFSEAREFRRLNGLRIDDRRDFDDYLVYGGLPKSFEYPEDSVREKYIRSVLEETKEKDILMMNDVRDRHLLDGIMRYLASAPGAGISSTSIKKYLVAEGVRTTPATVQRYLDMIFASYVASKCERFDVVGKKALKTLYKSYLADPSLHTLVSGRRDRLDYGMLVENVVYNELVSRGYEVMVGKKGPYEIDFVVFRGYKKAYVQVAYRIHEDNVEREEGRLLSLKDNHPKYIISMEPINIGSGGIIRLHLVHDFLLGDGFTL